MRRTLFGLACLLSGFLVVHSSSAEARPSDSPAGAAALIDRFLSGTGEPIASYRAFRTLEAETRNGQMRARLDAWTTLDPVRGFEYSIVHEEGSSVIRQKVLHAALDAERAMRTDNELSRGALTPTNYEFTSARDADAGFVQIGIHPKRHDTMLLEGSIVLTEADADLVRVEGFLIKRPSIWTRHVDVVRRYARIAGVRVPVTMESTAHVLIVGKSTFSMNYEYESINDVPIAGKR